MQLIDTHAHLYAPKFGDDRADMIARALAAGVTKMLLPNIDHTSIQPMLDLEAAYPDHCFAMMGLHPTSVKENYAEELLLVRKWLGERDFLAVGEIGIDLHWDKTRLAEQTAAFVQQVEMALEYDLPIVIHSRESTEELLDILEGMNESSLEGVFHCFTGTVEQAERIMEMGFYLGIGGVVTFKNGGLDETLREVPLSALLLETDAPYLAPVPYRGKRNESAYVRLVAERLAEVKEVDLTTVAEQTTANAYRLFRKLPK